MFGEYMSCWTTAIDFQLSGALFTTDATFKQNQSKQARNCQKKNLQCLFVPCDAGLGLLELYRKVGRAIRL